MNGHAGSRTSLSREEGSGLLDEKKELDGEEEASRSDFDLRFLMPEWDNVATTCMAYTRSVPWRLALLRLGIFLLPSFVQSRISRERTRAEKLMPTAYLDGMRGLAALFVYFCHYSYQSFTIAQGWGSAPNNYHVLKLPFLRLWYQGPVAVCVFFVISGYALSLKPLKQIRSRSYEDFAATLTSLTFRRGLRLYAPTMVSTFMVLVMLRLGVFEWTREFGNDRTYMKNIVEPHAERLGSTGEQLVDWVRSMFNFLAVFSWGNYDGSTREYTRTSTPRMLSLTNSSRLRRSSLDHSRRVPVLPISIPHNPRNGAPSNPYSALDCGRHHVLRIPQRPMGASAILLRYGLG